MVLDRHLKGTRRALEALEERLRLGQSKGTLKLGNSRSLGTWALRNSGTRIAFGRSDTQLCIWKLETFKTIYIVDSLKIVHNAMLWLSQMTRSADTSYIFVSHSPLNRQYATASYTIWDMLCLRYYNSFHETLREMCPNTGFFLVRIFPHSDWTLRISPYSVRMRKNTDQKKLLIWTHFTQWDFPKRNNLKYEKLGKHMQYCTRLICDN